MISTFPAKSHRNVKTRTTTRKKRYCSLVSRGSSSPKVEMLDFWGLDASSMPASSALNQQRQKLKPAALDISYIRLHKHLYHYNFWKADTQSVFLSCHKNQKFRFHLVYGTSAWPMLYPKAGQAYLDCQLNDIGTQVVFRKVFSSRLCMKITSFTWTQITIIDFVCINCWRNEVRVNQILTEILHRWLYDTTITIDSERHGHMYLSNLMYQTKE